MLSESLLLHCSLFTTTYRSFTKFGEDARLTSETSPDLMSAIARTKDFFFFNTQAFATSWYCCSDDSDLLVVIRIIVCDMTGCYLQALWKRIKTIAWARPRVLLLPARIDTPNRVQASRLRRKPPQLRTQVSS